MNIIENQKISETIPVHGLLSGATIGTWQADYPLTALDFEHVKNGKPITFNWANSILLATIGFAFNVFGKYISQVAGISQDIHIGEWVILGVGLIISLLDVVWNSLCPKLLPNDRKRVIPMKFNYISLMHQSNAKLYREISNDLYSE